MSHAPPRRIFITVAEVSGDLHAAHLIRSLKLLDSSIIIEGLGGPEMRAAGAIVHHETVKSAAMGFSAALRAPEVIRLLAWTRNHFKTCRPDLQICCDSWGMNKYFAKLAHGMGVPVLYYIAPQVWASREGRVKKLRKWVDQLACILPFEEVYFRGHGVKATFVGHPLFDELPARRPRPVARDFADRPPVVGLLPGSRRAEAAKNLPAMLRVAERIRSRFPGVKFLVPTTAGTDAVVHAIADGVADVVCKENAFDEVVPQCDLCITVSGTAALHVAGHLVPMLVVYRLSPISWHGFGRWIVRTRTFALVNLLSEGRRHIVPEFIPWFGEPEAVSDTAIRFLEVAAERSAQVDELAKLLLSLDKTGASLNVARMAVGMISGGESNANIEHRTSSIKH
jgi:lipid-A-disaccharide synthase